MIDLTWALGLLISFLVGGITTGIVLRRGASRAASQMQAMVADGTIVWGSQVRERVGARWGFSGRLLGTATTLKFVPDHASAKRGAQVMTWPVETTRLDMGAIQRDITGLTYRMMSVTDGGTSHDFGCAKIVGNAPEH